MHFCAFLYAYLKRFSTRHADVSPGSLNLKPKPFLQFDIDIIYRCWEVHNTANQQTQGKIPALCYTTFMQHPYSLLQGHSPWALLLCSQHTSATILYCILPVNQTFLEMEFEF